MTPTLRRASCPSSEGVKSSPMPSSDGSAASAAARVRSTRWPRAPAGGRALGASTNVSTPRNGSRFGCLATRGIAIAMDSICIWLLGSELEYATSMKAALSWGSVVLFQSAMFLALIWLQVHPDFRRLDIAAALALGTLFTAIGWAMRQQIRTL